MIFRRRKKKLFFVEKKKDEEKMIDKKLLLLLLLLLFINYIKLLKQQEFVSAVYYPNNVERRARFGKIPSAYTDASRLPRKQMTPTMRHRHVLHYTCFAGLFAGC